MSNPMARALLFDGESGCLRLEEREKPAPGPGEVLVRVTASTICGSDLHTIHGRRQVAVPTILGHEIIGTISEFGPDSAAQDMDGALLRPGDRVTWTIVGNCGRCQSCALDMPQKCTAGFKYGHERDREGVRWAGGFADWCLLAPGTCIVRLPDAMADEVACPASCATATICAAMEAAAMFIHGTWWPSVNSMPEKPLASTLRARSETLSHVVARVMTSNSIGVLSRSRCAETTGKTSS